MINELKTAHTTVSLTDFAFSILDKVAQGDYTKWSIVYDISNKKISFKTADYKNVKSFSFGAFDFACSANSLMFGMNQAASGEIAGRFIVQDKQVKRAITEKAVMESRQYVNISEADKKTLLEFEDGVRCN